MNIYTFETNQWNCKYFRTLKFTYILYIYLLNWNWMILEGKQNINNISKIFHFTHWTLRIETIAKIQDVSPMEKKPIHNYIYEI